ncbi:hypothetical protein HELRODRAFT_180252 [Helobdella robusta]|uniref:CHCH domain-containing protein n=1 Tax=Helobdella robusta TaxID=6412 RepID=T1FFN0_HELRO|nr:hypothetical protein HELRODRAFT_180252 [Helobdella robusta]ESN94084.1 hypothetical protein HELRODRAFT_180252 [Helobdella robusta]
MGGGQSVQEASSNEADNDSIIGISEAVAKRLLGKNKDDEQPAIAQSDGTTSQVSSFRPVSLEANTLYLSKKEQIKVFENYYKQQLKSLEEQNKILKETSQAQFQAAVNEIHKKFPKPLRKDPLCKELQSIVVQCYTDHKDLPLACSHEVKSFVDCVHRQSQKQKIPA